MKLFLTMTAALLLAATPALAQDDAPKPSRFNVDIGPGFFTTLDDTTDAAAVETYLAVGVALSPRFVFGARINASTIAGEDGTAKIAGAPWGFVQGFLTGQPGGLRTYVELAVSTRGTIAVRGGAEVGVAEGLAAFATADGRKLSDEEAKDLLGLSGGMRFRF